MKKDENVLVSKRLIEKIKVQLRYFN